MEKEYTRLPGSGANMGIAVYSRHRLFLGRDHILSVTHRGYVEEYRRFYFKDVQAITMRPTQAGLVYAILLGLVCLLFAILLCAGLVYEWPGLVTGLAVALPGTAFFTALLSTLLRGPTCETFIRTAVQTERILSVNRLRTAQKLLARLRPLIEAAQGPFTVDELAILSSEPIPVASPVPAPMAPAPAPVRAVPPPPPRPYAGVAHHVLFGVLLADFCLSALQFFAADIALSIAGAVLLVLLIAALVWALIAQGGTNLTVGIKTLTWLALAYAGLSYILGIVLQSVYMVQHPEMSPDSLSYFKAAAAVSPYDSLGRLALLIFSMACSGSLGLFGLLLLSRFKSRSIIPPALPVPPPAPPDDSAEASPPAPEQEEAS